MALRDLKFQPPSAWSCPSFLCSQTLSFLLASRGKQEKNKSCAYSICSMGIQLWEDRCILIPVSSLAIYFAFPLSARIFSHLLDADANKRHAELRKLTWPHYTKRKVHVIQMVFGWSCLSKCISCLPGNCWQQHKSLILYSYPTCMQTISTLLFRECHHRWFCWSPTVGFVDPPICPGSSYSTYI